MFTCYKCTELKELIAVFPGFCFGFDIPIVKISYRTPGVFTNGDEQVHNESVVTAPVSLVLFHFSGAGNPGYPVSSEERMNCLVTHLFPMGYEIAESSYDLVG